MIIRDPNELNVLTRQLWEKQEGLIIVYNLPLRLFETKRTLDRQKELVENGASRTLNSKHLTGDAWDVALWKKGGWSWEDIFFFQVLGILTHNLISGLKWGADWDGKEFWFNEGGSLRDWGHYQAIES